MTLRGRAVPAEVVALGYSGCLDLALIKVNQSNLPVMPLSDITQVHKTQQVFAIGFPGALPSDSATITSGIVSNLHHRDGLVQFDGAISPGNSGGAVVSHDGKLIGIATKGIETFGGRNVNGMFFAVAVDKVQAFVTAYQNGEPALIGQDIMPGSNPDSGHLTQALALNGQTIGGILQAGDSAVCGDSTLADVYTFTAEAGQGVMIDLSSPDMSVDLLLVSPSGQVVGQSRSQGRNQAAIVLEKLPENGTYSVIAKASQSNRDGRYQLRATEPVLVERGALDRSTRPCFEGGQRCQDFQFQGRANQTVTVALQHAEFDPYLVLLDASGNVIARGQTDRNALVNFTLPEDGWYTLVVSSLQPEGSGQFIVSVHDTETLITSKENVQ
ncbi:MAG: trypsin-like serine protease [Leptolyngbyaceae cyanobacterium SM2_5_2]|nr:trypsin-like serine protease [Leptolyngbyaceae cyanobacterium SM2_5_2]